MPSGWPRRLQPPIAVWTEVMLIIVAAEMEIADAADVSLAGI